MSVPLLQKYLPSSSHKSKYKKQCLRQKNILFQNDQLQLSCKIISIYDFYSSSNYLQINLFIGNKTTQPIDLFRIEFRGTNNLEMFVEEKNRSVRERTQYKERIIVGCNNYQEDVFAVIDFQSAILTLKSIPLPITLYNFCTFNKAESIPPTIQNESDLQQLLEHKYEYIEEQQLTISSSLFKKGIAS